MSQQKLPDTAFTGFVSDLRQGEDEAVRAFCQRYGAALERLAQRNLASGVRVREGADDVVQSVYRTFFRRAADGQFVLGDSQDLWRLLCAITLNKVREKARFHGRQRRGWDREVALDDGAPTLTAPDPAADEIVAFVELFEAVLDSLDEEERRMVDLKLQDRSNAEIAAALQCSERTVRRILARMKHRFATLSG